MRIIKKIFYLLLTLLLFSCSHKALVIPKELLQPEQMRAILKEIHLAQSAIAVATISDSSKYTITEYEAYIFQKNKTTQVEFTKSIAFYSAHPDVLQPIYDSVLVDLNKLQSEMQSKK